MSVVSPLLILTLDQGLPPASLPLTLFLPLFSWDCFRARITDQPEKTWARRPRPFYS